LHSYVAAGLVSPVAQKPGFSQKPGFLIQADRSRNFQRCKIAILSHFSFLRLFKFALDVKQKLEPELRRAIEENKNVSIGVQE